MGQTWTIRIFLAFLN